MSEAAHKARLAEITFDKHLRFRLDEAIQELRARPGSAERTLAFRAMQTARHWLGEDLAILGAQHPYPNGNNPANTVVDPPADVASRRSDERAFAEWQEKAQNHIDVEHTKIASDVLREESEGHGIALTPEAEAHMEKLRAGVAPQGSYRHVHDLPSPRR